MKIKFRFYFSVMFIGFSLMNIYSFAQSIDWSWLKTGGGRYDEVGERVTFDLSGNTIAVGTFNSDSMILDMDTLYKTGNSAIFIAKYSAGGNILWTRTISSSNLCFFPEVSTDEDGNIIVAGGYSGSTLHIGNDSIINSGQSDAFVCKFSPMGNTLWIKSVSGTGSENGCVIKGGMGGEIYLSVSTDNDSLYFDSTFINFNGEKGWIITKLDSSGSIIWVKNYSGRYTIRPIALETDKNDNIFLAGQIINEPGNIDTLKIDTISISFQGAFGFITKFNTTGSVQWAKLRNATDERIYSLSTDRFGNVYSCGSARPIFTPQISMAKYSNSGSLQWERYLGSTDCEALGIHSDSIGNFYMCGYFGHQNLTIDSVTISNNTFTYDMYLMKFDSAGNIFWAEAYGINGTEKANDISINTNGEIAMVGSVDFNSSILSIGQFTINGTQSEDFYILKSGMIGSGIFNHYVNDLGIYPNPSPGRFHFSEKSKSGKKIIVMDFTGRVVYEKNLNSDENDIDLSALKSGAYLISVCEKNMTCKFAKIVILK